MSESEQLMERAVKVIPGGVNSPVRAFGSIGMCPRFIKKADKATIWDEDGREYTDYVCSWGPMILGHHHPAVQKAVREACDNGLSFGAATRGEVEMAELMTSMVPSLEMVRMVNSGTEAVMSAIRVARGFTGRKKIVKFAGCYHGHSDALLVNAGSGALTSGVPNSAGVPEGCTEDTLVAAYNHADTVASLFTQYPEEIAAVIVEPVAANMGVVVPVPGFLQELRRLCDENSALLIFDEVITGFRLQADGAQGYYGIRPDLTTFGKIIGGGMPVGAYGGRREIMEMVSPCGPVYQAGTLSGNPVAMAAGYAQLSLLQAHPEYYRELNERADWFFGQTEALLREEKLPYQVNHVGSLGSIFFTDQAVIDDASAKSADTGAFAEYARYMLDHGNYVAPSQFEAMFLSTEHTQELLLQTLSVMRAFFIRNSASRHQL